MQQWPPLHPAEPEPHSTGELVKPARQHAPRAPQKPLEHMPCCELQPPQQSAPALRSVGVGGGGGEGGGRFMPSGEQMSQSELHGQADWAETVETSSTRPMSVSISQIAAGQDATNSGI